ncbi:MAG: hypothetical protein ACI9UU_001766 [Candidatus Azotimanducaceae bacterium]|jgi:hypothetical protein
MEEIVATAPNRCGPWPLRHVVTRGCEYPVLKAETDKIAYALRSKLMTACLVCSAQICKLRTLPVNDERICSTLFATPRRIISLSSELAMGKREFDARFRYDITVKGRIENIELIESKGMPPDAIVGLLREGAQQVRYHPIATEQGPVSVAGQTSSYVMQVRD